MRRSGWPKRRSREPEHADPLAPRLLALSLATAIAGLAGCDRAAAPAGEAKPAAAAPAPAESYARSTCATTSACR
jgi:hypothetical protein